MTRKLQNNRQKRVLETDEEILTVIETIYRYYQETSELVGPLGNIFAVFFHDLIIHFSGVLIQRISSGHYVDVPRFPYVGKKYALSPHRVNLSTLSEAVDRRRYKDWLREIQLIPLAIGNSLPYGYKQGRIVSKLVSLVGGFQRPVKAYLPMQSKQIDTLLCCINDLCSDHGIPAVKVIQDNWAQYAEAHTKGEQIILNQESIILGNRQDLQNRKLAVNFLQQDKEVVTFTHGEIASTVFDEPMIGYGERALCTTLVEYGEKDSEDLHDNALVPPQTILYRSSSVAKTKYQKNDSIAPKVLSRSKVLYIPTTYLGNHIYGPFHAYEDLVYREWHSALVEAIPSLTVKAHPKSNVKLQPPGRVESRWLDDCINEYDVLIIDYMATSAVLSIISEKPIIYFDIGLRRLSERFERDLRARCEYGKIDINGDLREQIQACLENYSCERRSWSNIDMEKYIINDDANFNWFKLLHNTIRSK